MPENKGLGGDGVGLGVGVGDGMEITKAKHYYHMKI